MEILKNKEVFTSHKNEENSEYFTYFCISWFSASSLKISISANIKKKVSYSLWSKTMRNILRKSMISTPWEPNF